MATLQDVADHAGVSRSTASFVLNQRDEMRIAETTQERVRRAARELDYRPNLMARSLKTQRTQSLALLSDYVATDGFAGEIINGALAAAVAADHVLYIGEFAADRKLEKVFAEDFIGRQVDGFVYASSYAQTVSVGESLAGQPTVLANCLPKDGDIPAVVADSVSGGRAAGEHVLELGHTEGIYIVGEVLESVVAAVDRRSGLEAALQLGGVSIAGIIDSKWWPESSRESTLEFLESGDVPRVLVCMNDRVAMGAYEALARAGLSIPDDVAVLAFDDSPLASWLDPPLTSVAIPHYDIGLTAVEMVLTQPNASGTVRLPMPIHKRASTGPLR